MQQSNDSNIAPFCLIILLVQTILRNSWRGAGLGPQYSQPPPHQARDGCRGLDALLVLPVRVGGGGTALAGLEGLPPHNWRTCQRDGGEARLF